MSDRAHQSFKVRFEAAQLALKRPIEESVPNGDERNENQLIAAFTKGMRHNDNTTIAKKADFRAFVRAVNSGDVDEIARLRLGPRTDSNGNFIWRSDVGREINLVRGWESMAAGLTFDLQGPDAQSVAMPPAPLLTSQELIAEMAEVYLMALARDIPLNQWNTSAMRSQFFDFAIKQLNSLDWFRKPAQPSDPEPERNRRRGRVTIDNIFRGILPGSQTGPLLSQFLIAGSNQLGTENDGDQQRGIVAYGSITIDQRVRIATAGRDFMTDRYEFLDVQDGLDAGANGGRETYDKGSRLITNMRDLSTWVHFDALYEAYLNACIIMLANGYAFDPGLPFQRPDAIDKQRPFVNFGGPHILSLCTEVATRALKAVRYQKFNIHRRTRPEAIGGLINEKLRRRKRNESGSDSGDDSDDDIFPELDEMVDDLEEILEKVREANEVNNKNAGDSSPDDSWLLPMAYGEGSPMHPSYGSGHATVAGACVTILKAFFDTTTRIQTVYEVDPDTDTLVQSSFQGVLTVEGELNKLADNISIARNMAGVHYFTDAYESLLLGEKIAIGILEEQKLTYVEDFEFTLPKFNGDIIKI